MDEKLRRSGEKGGPAAARPRFRGGPAAEAHHRRIHRGVAPPGSARLQPGVFRSKAESRQIEPKGDQAGAWRSQEKKRLRPSGIVFDLDGTLIDSRHDLATAVNRLRAELGMAPLAVEEVVGMVGEGARLLVSRALGPDFPAERFEAAFSSYRGFYMDVCLDATVAYEGISELIAELYPRYPLAVLTNKGERISRVILEGLGLARYFRAIVGGDSLPARKPDPGGLIHIGGLFGVPVEDLLLIGDSRFDAETAHAAGCQFAFVEWGFATPAEQGEITADLRVRTAEELTAALT